MNNRKTKKSYWFYIETYVHMRYSAKHRWFLLYNTLNGQWLEYRDKPAIMTLAKKLTKSDNLQVIKLTETGLEEPGVHGFVESVMEAMMGDIIDTAHSEGKPVQYVPRVYIQDPVESGVLEYLTRLTLYVNDRCFHRCPGCLSRWRQFPTCREAAQGESELDPVLTARLLDQLKNSGLKNIDITGGNLFLYKGLKELWQTLQDFGARKTFMVHYLNAADGLEPVLSWPHQNTSWTFHVSFPVRAKQWKALLKVLKKSPPEIGKNTRFVFIISSEEEFHAGNKLVEKSNGMVTDFSFQPYYNGENLDFFRELVYIDREDIFDEGYPIELRRIYTRSKINGKNFGHLTILSNGDIHANVNTTHLGVLGKTSIHKILHNEITKGKSWRRVRKNLTPCKGCPYQDLCPAPDNYTYALGKNNLCHIY